MIGCVAVSATWSNAAPLEQSLVPVTRPSEAKVLAFASPVPVEIRPKLRPETANRPGRRHAPRRMCRCWSKTSPIRPLLRPKALELEVLFKKRKLRKTSVCGDIDIQGKPVGSVPGKIKACGIKDAVQVTSVSGVALSRPSTMDCGTAIALNKWVDKTVKPTFKRRGPVVEIQVAAHYACRTRNNRKGAKISEHGKGQGDRYLGIQDGRWRSGDGPERLAQEPVKAAIDQESGAGRVGRLAPCWGQTRIDITGTISTLDTARHRRGPYCR